MVRENIYNKKIPKYSSVNSILKHFNIREKQLENLLQEMEKNQRLAYTYYYGINRPKLDLEDISEMLHVSENVVKIYINQADDFIQRFCQNITAPIPGVVENKGRRTKNKKISFFDYFDEKDKPLILEIIEEYKEKDSDYYEILVKACGEKYDHLVLSALTREEKIKLNNFRAIIKNKIKNGNFSKKPSLTKKQSFFDYFEEKDKPLVLEIIEEYKEKDSDYYKVLIKEYGEQYDSLVVPSLLNDREKNRLRDFKSVIREKLQDVKSTKNQTLQNEDFNYDLSMSYIYRRFPNLKQEKEADLIILTSFINKKKSVESISALTKFPIKKIDFILLKHLYVFSFKMPEIIEDILRRGTYTVSQIVNFNYIQTQVPFLNDKEKELLYLKMVELYQNQLSDVLKFSDKEMKYKMKTLKFENFN